VSSSIAKSASASPKNERRYRWGGHSPAAANELNGG
jgi:hypothetical protein